MIGMMYLVLTSLLALNVSRSVLDAFTLVDEGLTQTTENFAKKNGSLYGEFASAYELNPKKVGEWKEKAEDVQKRAQELYDFMQECKKDIVIKSEGPETDAIRDGDVHLQFVKGKDNTSIPAEVMILNKKGDELKEKIDDYREFLLDMVEDKDTYASVVSSIESALSTEPPESSEHSKGEHLTWESENFEHLPLASVITILSKMQNDVKNSEAEILAYLLSQIDAGSFKFNKIDAVVTANSDYVFRGQEYKAKVFLAAYDSTKFPVVKLDNGKTLDIEEGKGIYMPPTNAIGTHTWGGTITLEGDDGVKIAKTFQSQYQVAEASAVVSPTKMNVFYRGVDNPVAISVSGVPSENIRATITKGNIQPSRGGWVVKPLKGPEGEVVTVKVYANIENNQRFMGSMDFRVKDVPDPVAEIRGRTQGGITLTELTRAKGVEAELKNFDFDLDFTVTDFTVSAVLSGGFTKSAKSTNNEFTPGQLEILSQLTPGKTLTVTDIKAIGPDGKSRVLNSIVFKIL